ncbi:hypothetical protein CR970_00645 [Candidatus Saccharibacteria bacterium]|nr:MAG: hypothetical protein CR970_00645 [Candidatus Saccharibacteria bacterium]
MSTEKPAKRTAKRTETLRQRAERTADSTPRTRRLRSTAGAAGRPFKAARRVGRKEYHLPLPDNRLGRFLNKKCSLVPRFLRNAWQEIRQVDLPRFPMVVRLTIAVFVFSTVFGLVIAIVDFGLDKVFRKVFL